MYSENILAVMGNNLRAIRKNRHMTQVELSEAVGANVHTVWRLENNMRSYGGHMDVWIRLCNVLGCSLDDLTKDCME